MSKQQPPLHLDIYYKVEIQLSTTCGHYNKLYFKMLPFFRANVFIINNIRFSAQG